MSYKDTVTAKIKARNAQFPSEWLIPEDKLPKDDDVSQWIKSSKLLTEKELQITESRATVILSNIHSQKWSSLEVVSAFAHRASIANQLVNPLTEVFFNEAFEQAKELDELLNTTGKVKGPLHGLPICFKDEFNIKGQHSTIGLVSFISHPPASQDSPVVKILRDQGAVFYLKTNTPIGAFNIVTYNNIFGKTVNPFNRRLASGGSSGGEAALVALKGSPLGIGSDLGGSIRQPSSFQNLFALKPSSLRFPHRNTTIIPGLESLNGTNGPISTDVDSLKLYAKTIVDSQPWLYDSRVVPLEWKNIELTGRKLKFGVLIDDGVIRPTAPVQRALDTVIEKLKSEGHEIVIWEADDISEIAKFADKFMNANGNQKLVEELEKTGEPHSGLQGMKEALDIPSSQIWEWQDQRTIKVNEFLQKWNNLGIDGLISPVTALGGCDFDDFVDVTYSPLANVLDFPAGVFPVLRVDAKIDRALDIRARNETEQSIHSNYNPEKVHGGCVGLQVIGRKYEEEKVIEMVRLISKTIGTLDYWK